MQEHLEAFWWGRCKNSCDIWIDPIIYHLSHLPRAREEARLCVSTASGSGKQKLGHHPEAGTSAARLPAAARPGEHPAGPNPKPPCHPVFQTHAHLVPKVPPKPYLGTPGCPQSSPPSLKTKAQVSQPWNILCSDTPCHSLKHPLPPSSPHLCLLLPRVRI